MDCLPLQICSQHVSLCHMDMRGISKLKNSRGVFPRSLRQCGAVGETHLIGKSGPGQHQNQHWRRRSSASSSVKATYTVDTFWYIHANNFKYVFTVLVYVCLSIFSRKESSWQKTFKHSPLSLEFLASQLQRVIFKYTSHWPQTICNLRLPLKWTAAGYSASAEKCFLVKMFSVVLKLLLLWGLWIDCS